MNHTTHRSTFLPVEVWNAIFRDVERNDLTTLATVSRRFQQEAEHVLYHRVDLRNTTDGARLASWCTSILDNRRRASRVQALWISEYFKLLPGDSSTEIQQLVAQAFKALVNLKRLTSILHILINPIIEVHSPSIPTIVRSTFENCSFRLTGIRGRFPALTMDEMWEFLNTQPKISLWIPSGYLLQTIDAIPSDTLPSMREVVLIRPEKLPFLYGRPIQKLWLSFTHAHHAEHGLAVIRSLRWFKDTLRALAYIVFASLTTQTTLDVIRSLSEDAQNVEWLKLRFRNIVSFWELPRRLIDSQPPWY
jgi:hypothetical protein